MKNSGPITSRTLWRGTRAAIVKKSNRLPVVSASTAAPTAAPTAAAAAAPAASAVAAAAAAATATVTTAATTATTTTWGTFSCDIHADLAAIERASVKGLFGGLRAVVVGESHKAEAS